MSTSDQGPAPGAAAMVSPAETGQPEVSIVMPCLNEAETVERCIHKAQAALAQLGVPGEIVIADNGSTDDSVAIAARAGARVVSASVRGYGAALRAGIAAARGTYVIMGDADDSYDFLTIAPFVEKLRAGYQLVMGTRIRGQIQPGAMPPLHRWLGVPVLTALGNLFFGTRISDYHCGLRGFDRAAVAALDLRSTGMEFATEMVAKAALNKLSMVEIPIVYYPDGRSRAPHLRTWQDGWRHLELLLLLSPNWIFLYPGLALVIAGLVSMAWLLPGPRTVGGVGFDVHTLLVSGVAIIVGVQVLTFWIYAHLFAASAGYLPASRFARRVLERFSLRAGLLAGGLLGLLGLIAAALSFELWAQVEFGALDYQIALRRLIPGVVLVALGMHVFFASFVISLLSIRTR